MADKFLSMVVSQYSLPEYTMSDHNPQFCGNFWGELISFLETTITFSTALHPQTYGMTEITSHTMECFLYIVKKLGA